MTRTTTQRLLLCAALLHLFADVAYAGAAILCVGPNEHRAIETEHPLAQGCPSQPTSDAAGFSNASSTGDCIDSPLHSEAELVSSSTDTCDGVSSAATLSVALEAERLALARLPRAQARDPDLPPELRAHRGTVLLL